MAGRALELRMGAVEGQLRRGVPRRVEAVGIEVRARVAVHAALFAARPGVELTAVGIGVAGGAALVDFGT